MKEVIISVGMGPGQIGFIKRLKELNYKVVAFGKGGNAVEAKYLCESIADIDTRNSKEAIKWIDSLGVKVIGVGSFAGGQAVHTVQALSNYYHVSTKIPEDLVVGSSKEEQQKLLEKYNLSSIYTWKVKELTVDTINQDINDEYILKPSIGRGSKGIEYLNKDHLKERILNNDLDEDDIIQVVRKGREYRCVFIIQNQAIKLLAPILRRSYRDTVFLGVLEYTDKDLFPIKKLIEMFVQQAGINNSIIKADIIVSDNSIDIIEMDIGVGGGGYFQNFVSRIYEKSVMDEYINLIADKPVGKFYVKNPQLRMDYVYNRNSNPIKYDMEKCNDLLGKKLGKIEIQVNILHPENKGGFSSNADFIFAVIYNHSNIIKNAEFDVDDLANEILFEECNVLCQD